jgi:nucleoside-diphosphate-sugar epimerase
LQTESVLITGAAGFIGSHLTERCLELGWRVTGVDALTDYYEPELKRQNLHSVADHEDFAFVEGDLLDLDLLGLLAGVTVVFHLAAQPGVRDSWDEFDRYTRDNIEATQRLLDAARANHPRRVVLASSSSIYGDAATFPTTEAVRPRPVSPYGVTKLAAEHLADVYWRNFSVPTVILRFFTVYGPRQRPDMAFRRLIDCALADEPFRMFGDGEQTRDFTFVRDAVAAVVAAAWEGTPGRAYNIGGGSPRTMNEVLGELGALLGRTVAREYVERQVGDARDTAADISRARREIGFAPRSGLREGLTAQLEWQRALAMPGVLDAVK